MRVTCLCPTFRRPALLEQSIGCFEQQDYDDCELLILDDANQIRSHSGKNWRVISVPNRFNSLSEKYNALAGMASGSALCLWEDDDLYLPWHVSSHAKALRESGYSKPSKVWSLYTGEPQIENAAGRFHGSIAFARERFLESGGWPLTTAPNFDAQFMSRLGEPVDTLAYGKPSYVFRWHTNSYHGQAMGEDWWEAAKDVPQGHTYLKLNPVLCADWERMKTVA